MAEVQMVKIYLSPCNFINKDMIAKNFEIVNTHQEADLVISGSYASEEIAPEKLIFCLSEPAICAPRLYWYERFDKMFLVACYNPDKDKPNQIPVSKEGKNGIFYPTNCAFSYGVKPKIRDDTKIKNRAIFFAGELGLEDHPDRFGFKNIRKLRRELGHYCMKNLPGSICLGNGWPAGISKKLDGSDMGNDKQAQIDKYDCDFILSLENAHYPDFINERLVDGFLADRVNCYLGPPNIDKHCPTNAFVDLRPYFNADTKNFDFEAFKNRLLTMTQEEYDNILKNAREIAKIAFDKYIESRDDLTQRIIDRINQTYKPLS